MSSLQGGQTSEVTCVTHSKHPIVTRRSPGPALRLLHCDGGSRRPEVSAAQPRSTLSLSPPGLGTGLIPGRTSLALQQQPCGPIGTNPSEGAAITWRTLMLPLAGLDLALATARDPSHSRGPETPTFDERCCWPPARPPPASFPARGPGASVPSPRGSRTAAGPGRA